MCVPRETPFGDNSLCTPILFASYRLGDVPGAGVRFFPWDMTRTEAILINAYDFTRFTLPFTRHTLLSSD